MTISKTGAGAVVTKDVPAGKLAVGVPARIREIRPIEPADRGRRRTRSRRPAPSPRGAARLMGNTLFEIGIIVLLVMLNAVFVAAEIALVSLRRSRVDQLVDEGRRGARRVRRLTSDPGRFLAVIQLAITFIGFLASAFAGVSLAVALADLLVGVGMGPRPAAVVALLVVTILLSLFTIVFGELVPKTLALAHPEAFALRSPVRWTSSAGCSARSSPSSPPPPGRSPACWAPRSPPRPGSLPTSCASSWSAAASRGSWRPRRSR